MSEREKITWEELAWSNQIQQEALVRILISKGIITQEELLNESPRVCRRPKLLRGLAYENTDKIFPGSTRASRSHGFNG